jgi:hypothetical protein
LTAFESKRERGPQLNFKTPHDLWGEILVSTTPKKRKEMYKK